MGKTIDQNVRTALDDIAARPILWNIHTGSCESKVENEDRNELILKSRSAIKSCVVQRWEE